MRSLLRHPRRAWQVVTVFLRYWLAPKLGGGPRNENGERAGGPQRMRLALEELGGAWVKLGQMLAMRFDLLPAAYGDEMFKLLNQVRPFPYSQVQEIVARELGGPPEEVFQSFEPEIVRRRLDRPGASGGTPLGRGRRREGPATGRSSEHPGRISA